MISSRVQENGISNYIESFFTLPFLGDSFLGHFAALICKGFSLPIWIVFYTLFLFFSFVVFSFVKWIIIAMSGCLFNLCLLVLKWVFCKQCELTLFVYGFYFMWCFSPLFPWVWEWWICIWEIRKKREWNSVCISQCFDLISKGNFRKFFHKLLSLRITLWSWYTKNTCLFDNQH